MNALLQFSTPLTLRSHKLRSKCFLDNYALATIAYPLFHDSIISLIMTEEKKDTTSAFAELDRGWNQHQVSIPNLCVCASFCFADAIAAVQNYCHLLLLFSLKIRRP